MTQRIRLDDLTSDQLDALYERIQQWRHRALTGEAVARGALAEAKQRAQQAEAALGRVHHDAVRAITAWRNARQRANTHRAKLDANRELADLYREKIRNLKADLLDADALANALEQRAEQAEDQVRRYGIELTHWQTVIVPELRTRAEQAEAALADIRDAAALHRKGLIGAELYAVIDARADGTPSPAEASLDRVRALHRKASHGDNCAYCWPLERIGYDATWPCDTIRAIDGTTPAPAEAERCPSCEHGVEFHTDPAGCWHSVSQGKPGQNIVCACAVTAPAATEATNSAEHPTAVAITTGGPFVEYVPGPPAPVVVTDREAIRTSPANPPARTYQEPAA